MFPDDFTYHQIRIADHLDSDIVKHFEGAFKYIDEAIASGGTVFVHCNAGISRSSSIVAAYLIHSKKWKFEQAALYVRSKRLCANFNSFDT